MALAQFRLALFAACVAALAGCAESGSCTEAGSVSVVTVHLPAAVPAGNDILTARVCVNARCGTPHLRPERDRRTVRVPVNELPESGDVGLQITIRTADGRALLDASGRGTVGTDYPNGASCPGVRALTKVRLKP